MDISADEPEQIFGLWKVPAGGAWLVRGRYTRFTPRTRVTVDRRDVLAGLRTCVQ